MYFYGNILFFSPQMCQALLPKQVGAYHLCWIACVSSTQTTNKGDKAIFLGA